MYETKNSTKERFGMSIEHVITKEFGSIKMECPHCKEVGFIENKVPYIRKQIFTIFKSENDAHIEYQNVDGICSKCKGGFRISNGIVIRRKRNWIEVPTRQRFYIPSFAMLLCLFLTIVLTIDKEGNIWQENELIAIIWVWSFLLTIFVVFCGFLWMYVSILVELKFDERYYSYKGQVQIINKEVIHLSQQEQGKINKRLKEQDEKIIKLKDFLFINSSVLNFSGVEEQIFKRESELQLYIAKNINQFSFLGKQVQLHPNGIEYYIKDVGRIDILARDSDGNFIVIETKVNSIPDKTVGQISRYMGWVEANLNMDNCKVYGIIIGHKITKKLKYAVSLHDDIYLLKYSIGVKLKNIR